jgi:hypothetical protein
MEPWVPPESYRPVTHASSALSHRIRSYRTERKLCQEDMISYGFSLRHWQMIEGRLTHYPSSPLLT